MTHKQIIFSFLLITTNFFASQQEDQKPKVFNKGWNTNLIGDISFFDYTAAGILDHNAYTLPQAKVFKYEDDSQSFTEKGTLESYKIFGPRYDEIRPFIVRQNAVWCPCVETKFNRKNEETETIGAIIYNSRNPKHCEKVRQHIAEKQKHTIAIKYSATEAKTMTIKNDINLSGMNIHGSDAELLKALYNWVNK